VRRKERGAYGRLCGPEWHSLESRRCNTVDSAPALRLRPFVTMRRSSFALLLSFLLVFVQHGAVLHELGHLSHSGDGAGATLRADLQPSSGALCQSCEAYAQVANLVGCGAVSLPLDPAVFLRTADPCYGIAGADAPTPRSRGPPSV